VSAGALTLFVGRVVGETQAFSRRMMFQGGWGGGPGGFLGVGMPQGSFVQTYRCFPMSFDGKEDKENGDKIILPSSAFEMLARMTITYPMQFELRNEEFMDLSDENGHSGTSAPAAGNARVPRTHVGVLEFTAVEGRCFVPYWIMQNLLVPEGGYITVKNVTLPMAQFIKFRPQSVDFLDISNPKAVLESTLRNFSCVTKDDQICIPYNGKKYYLTIVDVQPADACSIVEADVKVDFEPPPGYVEPSSVQTKDESLSGSVTPIEEGGVSASSAASEASKADSENGGSRLGGDLLKEKSESFLAELAKAREARKRELEAKNAQYVAFSGHGQRVDGKKKRNSSSETNGDEAPQSTSKETEATVQVHTARKGKWKTKTKGSSFAGEGRSLQ